MHETSIGSVLLGGLALALVIGARTVSRRMVGPLIAMVVTGSVVAAIGWGHPDPRLIEPLTEELPKFQLPALGLRHWELLFNGALALSLLGLMEAYSIGTILAAKSGLRISANRKLFSQGLANFATGFFQ